MTRKEGVEGCTITLDNLLYKKTIIKYVVILYDHSCLFLRCDAKDMNTRNIGSMIS